MQTTTSKTILQQVTVALLVTQWSSTWLSQVQQTSWWQVSAQNDDWWRKYYKAAVYTNRCWGPWPGRGDIIIFEPQSESSWSRWCHAVLEATRDNIQTTDISTPDYSVWPCGTWPYRHPAYRWIESMFSTTGLILNSKRSILALNKLNYVLCVRTRLVSCMNTHVPSCPSSN